MGSGASSKKKVGPNKSIQVPSAVIKKPRLPSVESLPETEIYWPGKPRPPPPKPIPIPPDDFEQDYDDVNYSLIWHKDDQLVLRYKGWKQGTMSGQLAHHQKETHDSQWAGKYASSIGSANAKATVNNEAHGCTSISSTEDIDILIANLHTINVKLDDFVQKRTQKMSDEEAAMITKIIKDRDDKILVILEGGQSEQKAQEIRYRKLLEEFIFKLEQEKLIYMNKVQQDLQVKRERIMLSAQRSIMKITAQARIFKSKILWEEQQQASVEIKELMEELERISIDQKFQLLGSEELTKINMLIYSKFGDKAPGEHSSNISPEDLAMINSDTH